MEPNCCCICCELLKELLDIKLNAILQLLISIQNGKAVDLNIVFGLTPANPAKGTHTMGNKKATGSPVKCEMSPKGKVGAVMPDVTLTVAPASITLQPVDASNNPVTIQPTDSVVGTLASDSPSFVIGAGADTLHYVATLAAGIPVGTVVNLSATLDGTVSGATVSFTASVKITVNISPPSPVAVDLEIILG